MQQFKGINAQQSTTTSIWSGSRYGRGLGVLFQFSESAGTIQQTGAEELQSYQWHGEGADGTILRYASLICLEISRTRMPLSGLDGNFFL